MWKTIETGRLELSEGWPRPLNRSDRLTEVKITATERKKLWTLTNDRLIRCRLIQV